MFCFLFAGKDTISAQAALMYDAVFVLVEAFNKLLKKKPDIKPYLKKGPLFNNGSKLDCIPKSTYGGPTPLEHGEKISKILRKVSKGGKRKKKDIL